MCIWLGCFSLFFFNFYIISSVEICRQYCKNKQWYDQNHQHNQSVGSRSQKIAHFHVITMIMQCESLREISCSSDDRDWEVGRTGTLKRKNTSTTDQKKVPLVSGGSELLYLRSSTFTTVLSSRTLWSHIPRSLEVLPSSSASLVGECRAAAGLLNADVYFA